MLGMVTMDGDPTSYTDAEGLQDFEGVGVAPGGELLTEACQLCWREVGGDDGAGAALGDDFSLEIDDE